jgi:uncharacterized membrane protein YphA (DoxX/SURF4 family)
MNIALWVVQVILAAMFLMAGTTKVFRYDDFVEKQPPMKTLAKPLVQFIGICEILGAIGIVLPLALGIAPFLTPIAAISLALVMFLALIFHGKRGEWKVFPMPTVLMLLAIFVAWGRWMFLSGQNFA